MSSRLDESFQSFEKMLNVFGYIPIVSSVSGSVRQVYGNVQVIGGLATAVLSSLSNQRQAEHGLEIAVHGIANMCRSSVEMVPFLNLACIPYDMGNRFEYQSLKHRYYYEPNISIHIHQ